VDDVFGDAAALPALVSLLSSPSSNVAECAAAVLASCCSAKRRAAVLAAGAVAPLAALLAAGPRRRQEAALEALAGVARDPAGAAAVLSCPGVEDLLLGVARSSPAPRGRLMACACLTSLRAQLPAGEAARREAVAASVLPVLLRLLGDPEVGCQVAPALTELAEGSPELQRAAADADALPRLAALLPAGACAPRWRAAALRAVALLCAHDEGRRAALVAAGALPAVAAALAAPAPREVRAAAAAAVRSLSRSARALRGALGALGDLAAPLLELSRDADEACAVDAAAALANLALEYSVVRGQVLEGGGVARFAELSASAAPSLRLYGAWGLASLAYMATTAVKVEIMAWLGWPRAAALLGDDQPAVRVSGRRREWRGG
jgi:hypothetical protein